LDQIQFVCLKIVPGVGSNNARIIATNGSSACRGLIAADTPLMKLGGVLISG
jgi:hypothetical protein